MRLATFTTDDRQTAAVDVDGVWLDVGRPMGELVQLTAGELQALADHAGAEVRGRLDAPIAPGAIWAVGLNYRDHAHESGMEPPDEPLLFAKAPSSVVATGAEISVDPEVTRFVDWEVELALVIGRPARDVAPERAFDHVFGWTVANDVSARDLQQRDGQWARGKSLDTFCPLGPQLVTTDELGDPAALRLWTEVDGERVQDGTTADMLFPVEEIVSFCSRHFTLRPGDVILTGTPAGVGAGLRPPRSLQPGMTVRCGIDGIGELRNPVCERSAA